MDAIVQANIARFELLLETETDVAERAMILCLLAEEKRKSAREDMLQMWPASRKINRVSNDNGPALVEAIR